MELCLGKERKVVAFSTAMYPHHDGSPGGHNYGTMFLGMASCITFRMYAVFNKTLKFLTVMS